MTKPRDRKTRDWRHNDRPGKARAARRVRVDFADVPREVCEHGHPVTSNEADGYGCWVCYENYLDFVSEEGAR